MSPIPLGILAASGAGVASDFELIQTTIISTDQNLVSFNNIQSLTDYKDLRIIFSARSNFSGDNAYNLTVLFNNDSNANYNLARMFWNTSGGPSISTNVNAGGFFLVNCLPGSLVPGATWGSGVIDIFDWQANKAKSLLAQVGAITSGELGQCFSYGAWRTDALTSIDLSSVSGILAAGSTFSLYGLRG